MILTKYLDKTEATLDDLQKKIANIKEGHLIDSFLMGRFSLLDISVKLTDVKKSKLQLETEKLIIKKFLTEYNAHYYLIKKSYVGMCIGMMNRMRHTLKQLGQEFLDSCPPSHYRGVIINERSTRMSVFEASTLNLPEPKDNIFHLEEQDYNDIAKELINEYLEFNKEVVDLLSMCINEIKQSRNLIEKHPDKIVYLYEQDGNELMYDESFQTLLDSLSNPECMLTEDELSERIRLSTNTSATIASFYHKLDKKEYIKHKQYSVYIEGFKKGFKGIERTLWGHHTVEQVQKYRILMHHLDEVCEMYQNKKKKKISAETLAMVMRYCQPFDGGDDKSFIDEYMTKIHNSINHKYELTGYSAIKNANKISTHRQNDFNQRIDKMISEYSKTENSSKLTS